LDQSEDWIFCVSLATRTCSVWCNVQVISYICWSIGIFKRSVDTLIIVILSSICILCVIVLNYEWNYSRTFTDNCLKTQFTTQTGNLVGFCHTINWREVQRKNVAKKVFLKKYHCTQLIYYGTVFCRIALCKQVVMSNKQFVTSFHFTYYIAVITHGKLSSYFNVKP